MKRTKPQLDLPWRVARHLVKGSLALGASWLVAQICDKQLPPTPLPKTAVLPTPPATIEQIPTIYIHGFRGGDYTTNKMILSAQKVTHANNFLKIFVDWKGHLTYQGTWPTGQFPLLQLIFSDKLMPTVQIVDWLEKILPKLQQTFGFNQFNAVGHSIGATALVRLGMRVSNRKNFPRLHKIGLIAGPFDGVVAFGDWPNANRFLPSGRPLLMNPRYLKLILERHKFSSSTKVLNIYGNIGDGSNTDKYISVVSAQSLRYILGKVVTDYREVEITGEAAEHSKLHDDTQVLAIINRFLFVDP